MKKFTRRLKTKILKFVVVILSQMYSRSVIHCAAYHHISTNTFAHSLFPGVCYDISHQQRDHHRAQEAHMPRLPSVWGPSRFTIHISRPRRDKARE